MKLNKFHRICATTLSAVLIMTQPMAVLAVDPDTGGQIDEIEPIPDTTIEDTLKELEKGDVSRIHKPEKSKNENNEDITIWDCVWFGKYWQKDTNGDGYCFSKDITIHNGEMNSFYDQDNNRLYNFNGKPGKYLADDKQPVKWRVLDVDEHGNAFLLSDKIIEKDSYNEDEYAEDVTWDNCTLRSFLNGLSSEYNTDGTGSWQGLYVKRCDRLTIMEGNTVTLKPQVSPSNAADKTVTWKSSNEAVATVSKGGIVTGIKEGTATITVKTNDGGYEARCEVTVQKKANVPVTGITLPGQEDRTIKEGNSITLTPKIIPDNATNKEVIWKSSDDSVATVDKTGQVKGIKPGTAVITVKTNDGGFEATCNVTVIFADKSFVIGRDNNHFPHRRRSMFNDNEIQNYNFKISDYYYKKLKSFIPQNNYYTAVSYLISCMVDDWDGSCYGISSTMGMVKKDRLSVSEMTTLQATDYNSLSEPKNDDKLFNVINYYFLSQVISTIRSKVKISNVRRNEYWFETEGSLKGFLRDLVQNTKNETPVLFGYVYTKYDETYGHAVLALNSEYDQARDKYIVTIYDLNTVGMEGDEPGSKTKMEIASDYSYFIYTTVGGVSLEKYWVSLEIDDLNKFPTLNQSGENYIQDVEALTSTGDYDDSVMISVPVKYSTTIENNRGEILYVRNGTVSGNMAVDDLTVIYADDATSLKINVEESDSYTVQADHLDVDIISSERSFLVEGESMNKAVISLDDAAINLYGTNYSFKAGIEPAGSETVSLLEADATKNVRITEKSGKLVADSDGQLSNATVNAYTPSADTEKEDVIITDNRIVVPNASCIRTIAVKQKADMTGKEYFGKVYKKYSLSDKKLTSVNSKGILTGKKAGIVTVTGYTKVNKKWVPDTENAIEVTIVQPTISVKTVEKARKNTTLDAAENVKADSIAPTTWISSKPGVATIDDITGLVNVCDRGKTKITAVYGSGKMAAKYSFMVKVNTPSLNKTRLTMLTGQKTKLKLKNTKEPPVWSSTDDKTVHVFEGNVIAYRTGNATITATLDGVGYSCEVEIKPPVIKKSSVTVKSGGTGKVGLKNTKLVNIDWESTDERIAVVDDRGVVFGINPGTAEIYTESGGVRNSCLVTVVK